MTMESVLFRLSLLFLTGNLICLEVKGAFLARFDHAVAPLGPGPWTAALTPVTMPSLGGSPPQRKPTSAPSPAPAPALATAAQPKNSKESPDDVEVLDSEGGSVDLGPVPGGVGADYGKLAQQRKVAETAIIDSTRVLQKVDSRNLAVLKNLQSYTKSISAEAQRWISTMDDGSYKVQFDTADIAQPP
mmetsp:Transcript_96942/g.202562  ORF Transcript_96942/g.202562 Transcript_96942/m.202562 type:complete len:188 (+) Transcript_96942:116-679(+)